MTLVTAINAQFPKEVAFEVPHKDLMVPPSELKELVAENRDTFAKHGIIEVRQALYAPRGWVDPIDFGWPCREV